MIRAKTSADSMLLESTTFATNPDFNLQKFGSEQDCQRLEASLALAKYAERDPRERELYYTVLHARQSFVAQINEGQFL